MTHIAESYGIELQGCAELNAEDIYKDVPKLIRSGCADKDWAIKLKPELEGVLKVKPSRPGCLCCYDADWGMYASNGAPRCPNKCEYCYAK